MQGVSAILFENQGVINYNKKVKRYFKEIIMANRFGGFGGGFGGGNMQAMMKQAQKMQQDAMRAKEELESTVFEGSASGEMVKVEVNGAFEMVSVKINPAVVDPDDIEMLEDLVVAAYNDAKAKIDEKKESSLGAFGGLI